MAACQNQNSKLHQNKNHQCDDQCPNIGIKNKLSLLECENACNEKSGCTAFNFRETPPNCQLRNCPQPPPAPEGKDHGIPGFSTRSIGYFFTTEDNAFSDDQCPNIGSRSDVTLFECQEDCKQEEGCTAFNFELSPIPNCILRGCTLPVSPPNCSSFLNFDGYFHYKERGKNLSNQMKSK